VCGYETADSFRFCPECGAAAADGARQQRKVVTVLFCDVVGSTALGESRDAEAVRAVLARYFEQAKSIVGRHGGTVEKFIGDAVMAVFGVPTVREDDALRAVRVAAEIRAALPELGIEGRIGVNTGEVVPARRNGWRQGTPSTSPPGSSMLRRQVRSSSVKRPCVSSTMRSKSSPSSRLH
jgi:class 3 adenylate cyclase